MKFSIILWIHYFSSWSYAFHFLSLTIQTGLVLIINSIVHLTKPEGKTDYYYNEHFNENKFLLSTDLMPHGKIYFDSSYQDIHFTYLIKTYCISGCLRYNDTHSKITKNQIYFWVPHFICNVVLICCKSIMKHCDLEHKIWP